jgi:hypothetical protein
MDGTVDVGGRTDTLGAATNGGMGNTLDGRDQPETTPRIGADGRKQMVNWRRVGFPAASTRERGAERGQHQQGMGHKDTMDTDRAAGRRTSPKNRHRQIFGWPAGG